MTVRALDGIRVLDLAQGMAGSLATMILADYGAEVIRVEPPAGDPWWSRPAYLLWQRGKKSIEVDWNSVNGQVQLRRLIQGADVLVESLSPGEADRLGFGYRGAIGLNRALIYLSISAFGQHGPYRDWKAYDGIINAKSGRMHDQVGHYQGRPIYRAINDTSLHTAMYSVQAVLAALRVAWISGEGQHLETSLLDGTTAPFAGNQWLRFDGEELPPDRYPGDMDDSAARLRSGQLVGDRKEADPRYAIPSQLCVQCKDGRWIMHAHIQFDLFQAWIDTIGFSWIWEDERYKGAPDAFAEDADRIELNQLILARMKTKTSQEWIDLYRQNTECAGEVMQTTQEALSHPQFVQNGHRIVIEDPRVGSISQIGPLVAMSRTPAVVDRPAPTPGQDTERVLSEELRARPKGSVGNPRPRTPLDGVVILELATWMATPWAGALLADLGARVIKVEALTGDPFRAKPVPTFIRSTQGKESISLNLKRLEGQQVLHKLVSRADALMHNFRLGVPARLGADYETLRGIKPDLVYLYAGAYGSLGPDARRAGFNPTMGAFAGSSVFQSGEANDPIGDPSADPMAGSAVATAMMLGLAARWRTGLGQCLETTMINSVVYANSDDALSYTGKPLRWNPDRLQLGLEATYRLYATRNGWVFLACPTDTEFAAFCEAVELDHLIDDPRFGTWEDRYAHRDALSQILEDLFQKEGAGEWETQLIGVGVGCVQADRSGHRRFLYEDPHTRAVGFMVPTQHSFFNDRAVDGRYWRHRPVVKFSETPCDESKPFVALGEQTKKILEELGYDESEIDRLTDDNIVVVRVTDADPRLGGGDK